MRATLLGCPVRAAAHASALADTPWERMRTEAACTPLEDEVSAAVDALEDPRPFDELPDPPTVRRIRVGTDLGWSLVEEKA